MKQKSIFGHPEYHAQILKSSISSFCFPPSKLIFNLIKKYFWPKCHLLPILWSLGSLWVAHKAQNKLTVALFLKINEKKHTVVLKPFWGWFLILITDIAWFLALTGAQEVLIMDLHFSVHVSVCLCVYFMHYRVSQKKCTFVLGGRST